MNFESINRYLKIMIQIIQKQKIRLFLNIVLGYKSIGIFKRIYTDKIIAVKLARWKTASIIKM